MTAPTIPDFPTGVLDSTPLNTLADAAAFAMNPPSCIARRTTAQSIANNATAPFATITFDVEEFDNASMFTASSDTITIQGAGVYDLQATVGFAVNGTGVRVAFLTVSGTNVAEIAVAPSGGATETHLSVGVSALCVAGDTIKLNVFQNSGGALNTVTAPQSRLTVCRRSGT